MKKIFFAIIVSIIFYSAITISQPTFNQMSNQLFWRLILISNIAVGSIMLINTSPFRNILFYASTLYVFGVNGTINVLYYMVGNEPIPDRLEWLDNSQFMLVKPVTHDSLLLNIAIWSIIWVIIWSRLWKIIPVRINKMDIPK